jgi:hypothetical protein
MANQYFSTLADTGRWEDVALVFAGFLGASVVEAVAENSMGFDAPTEIYGAGAMIGAEMATSGSTKRMVQLGGGLHVVDGLASRFDVQSRIMGLV